MSTRVCPACNGTGEVEREVNRPADEYGPEEDVVVMGICDDCGGEGTIEVDEPSALAELAQAILFWEMESWKPFPKRPTREDGAI